MSRSRARLVAIVTLDVALVLPLAALAATRPGGSWPLVVLAVLTGLESLWSP